jgi:hypothetical protein
METRTRRPGNVPAGIHSENQADECVRRHTRFCDTCGGRSFPRKAMPSKKSSKIPPAKLDFYEKLIATRPDIECKGDVHPYTSMNGHMFSYLDQTGTMGLRLPKDELEVFLKKYKTKLFESYGVVKKDWATIPDSLLENTKDLTKYLKISYEYTKTLKPK